MEFNDRDQFELSRYRWVIPFVIIVLTVTVILVKCSSNNLKGFVDDKNEQSSSLADTSSVEEIIELKEETSLYSDDTYNFTLSIPVSWSKINGTGSNVSFVNRQTGAQLQVIVMNYDPQINSMDENLLTQQAVSNGMELREYSKPTNSSYSVSYCSSDYGYIEYSFWDYSAIIKLNFCVGIK